jgi:hypothetical protein
MANTSNSLPSLSVPGERLNPATGQREFDFDQLKVWMMNVKTGVLSANESSVSTNASVTAAYNQANLATELAEQGIETAEAAYAAANAALAQNTSGEVYIDGNLLLDTSNINFVDGNTTQMNGFTPDGVQAVVFVEVQPNLAITSLTTSGNINVGQTVFVAGNTDLYGQVNVAFALANTANNTANGAFAEANVANTLANNANTLATAANGLATQANNTANAGYSFANTLVQAITVANTSNLVISGNATNVVIDTVLTGGGGGGGGGNYQVDVYANGSLILANANLNFNNTATVNVAVTANGNGQANIAFTANVTGGGGTNATSVITDDVFVATNNQTIFNISSNVVATRYVFVYRNGVEQIPTTDYTSNGANVVVLTTGAFPGESIEVRNFTTVGNLTVSAGTTLIQQSNVALGAQPFYQTTYTYYVVPTVCASGMANKFTIQANTTGLFDVIVSATANVNNTTWLSATDITQTTYAISSPWYYQSGDGSQNLYIGIRNRGGNPMSFTLATLSLTKFS